MTNIEGGVEITSVADIPSNGTGLGSSSSFTVGLLNSLYGFKGNHVSPNRLGREACQIEIERCGEPIGKQDQYAAAFGGMNHIQFHQDGAVTVNPVVCRHDIFRDLESHLMIFFLGNNRKASDVLSRQQKALQTDSDKINTTNQIKKWLKRVLYHYNPVIFQHLENYWMRAGS